MLDADVIGPCFAAVTLYDGGCLDPIEAKMNHMTCFLVQIIYNKKDMAVQTREQCFDHLRIMAGPEYGCYSNLRQSPRQRHQLEGIYSTPRLGLIFNSETYVPDCTRNMGSWILFDSALLF